jgi:hypothetical protein
LDTAIALGLSAFRFEGTALAMVALVNPPFTFITIFGLVLTSVAVGQVFVRRTEECIAGSVIGKALTAKHFLADQFRFAVLDLFLVKGIVFNEIAQLMGCLEIRKLNQLKIPIPIPTA